MVLDIDQTLQILDALGSSDDPCNLGWIERRGFPAETVRGVCYDLDGGRSAARVRVTYYGSGPRGSGPRLVRGTLHSLVADRLRDYGLTRPRSRRRG